MVMPWGRLLLTDPRLEAQITKSVRIVPSRIYKRQDALGEHVVTRPTPAGVRMVGEPQQSRRGKDGKRRQFPSFPASTQVEEARLKPPSRATILIRLEMRVRDRKYRSLDLVFAGILKHEADNVIRLDLPARFQVTQH